MDTVNDWPGEWEDAEPDAKRYGERARAVTDGVGTFTYTSASGAAWLRELMEKAEARRAAAASKEETT